MFTPVLELEGTREEIIAQLPDFEGQTLHVTVHKSEPEEMHKAKTMTEALHIIAERSQRMKPKTDSLEILREGRAGAMWGYDPVE